MRFGELWCQSLFYRETKECWLTLSWLSWQRLQIMTAWIVKGNWETVVENLFAWNAIGYPHYFLASLSQKDVS